MQDIRLMHDRLREHILQRTTLTNDEFLKCFAVMVARRVRKEAYLLQEGEPSRHLAFVTRGCLRSYTIDKKGQEHIIQFAIEGWWISDLFGFLTGKPSNIFIDALEETDVLLIDHPSYESLCMEIPGLERYFRLLLQSNYIATHRRVLASISKTAEEQYLQLIKDQPAIVRRVAQRHIASYLGITPEALSRFRGRIVRHSAGEDSPAKA